MDKSSCYGNILNAYPSLADATSGCKNESKCTGIVDVSCENKVFYTCKGEMKFGSAYDFGWEFSSTLCFWKKSKGNSLW